MNTIGLIIMNTFQCATVSQEIDRINSSLKIKHLDRESQTRGQCCSSVVACDYASALQNRGMVLHHASAEQRANDGSCDLQDIEVSELSALWPEIGAKQDRTEQAS